MHSHVDERGREHLRNYLSSPSLSLDQRKHKMTQRIAMTCRIVGLTIGAFLAAYGAIALLGG